MSSLSDVFSLDTTKILSAECHLAWCAGLRDGHRTRDPGGQDDFRDIVDLITNGTTLTFRAPGSEPSEIGLLGGAIASIAEPSATPRVGVGRFASKPVSADAHTAYPGFATLLSDSAMVARILAWVQFQVADSRIQKLFWETNSESEISEAYKILARIPKDVRNLAETRARAQRRYTVIGHASQFLGRHWGADEFLLAYAFWAFVKGVRYARTLGEDQVYALHWLRREAATTVECHEKTVRSARSVSPAVAPVPWHCLVETIVSDRRNRLKQENLMKAILKLREYSSAEIGDAKSPSARRRFLRQGVRAFAGELHVPISRASALAERVLERSRPFVTRLATTLMEERDKTERLVGLVYDEVTKHVPELAVDRRIRLLVRQNGPELGQFIARGPRRW